MPDSWRFSALASRHRDLGSALEDWNGMGTAWTTLHLINDGEKQAADLLGIPFEDYAQAGLFPIAYTKGTDFKLAKRLPAEQLTHWDSW